MFIAKTKNNGKSYLVLAESYSVVVDGIRKNRRRIIKNIGPLDRFDDGKPNYLQRLRQSFRDGNPLIEGLKEYTERAEAKSKIVLEFDKNDESECFSHPKNMGYFLLDSLYDSLGIYDVMSKHKSNTKIEYDLNGLTKLLSFDRALSPCSKISTWNHKDNYLFGITESASSSEVYKVLDEIDVNAKKIQRRMNTKISSDIGRNTEACFYDVTNYYFEIDKNDEDIIIDGKIIKKGQKKKGVSKEHQKTPIVQMGLFMDDNGIPIAYELFPGSDIDQTTLRPALKKNIDKLAFDKVIVVADGGCNSNKNMAHILDSGNGYIFAKGTKKSDKETKAWIIDESGYRYNSSGTFKSKSEVRTRVIIDENGSEREISEKIISYWSKGHYEKEVHENQKFIEYLENVIANPDKLKDREPKIKKFLRKEIYDKDTGEKVKAKEELSLDMEKIEQYLNLMGYYTLLTSEVDKPDLEIINKYRGLSRIEDSFKVIKSDLEGRPVFVRKDEHVNAHFAICFIALTMIRIIQYKILKSQGKDTLNTLGWESGLSADRIKTALTGFTADSLPAGYYRTTEPTEDLTTIFNAIGVGCDLRLPTEAELRQFKYEIDKHI